MTGTATALCAAISIDKADGAPDWLHLLPADAVPTRDGRGPYRITDATALMAASMVDGKLALDENHATDLAAPAGSPAPAHGWIVELQQRADGIWGKVDWVDPGAAIWKRYRGISPVIAHTKDGAVTAILRASLTNTPNLTGLRTLHSEEKNMDFRKALLEALSLAGDADDAAVLAAIKAMKKPVDPKVALQAAIAPIALAVGLAKEAEPAAVLAGVEQLKGGADDRVTALQSELATVTTSLNAVRDEQLRDKATAFIDAAITAGRMGLKPVRTEYIAMHMKDAAGTEKLVNAMPILAPGQTKTLLAAVPEDEGTNDNPALLAQKAGVYQRKLAEGGTEITFAAAVRAVHEGKTA